MAEPDILSGPPPGTYPYRHTQDDRFQYRLKVQPAGECLEFVVRAVDTRKCAEADYRQWAGVKRGARVEGSSSDEDREDSLRRSTERARRMVRLLALELRADRLLTFTTRDVLPLETLQVVWDRFIRLVRLVHPEFAYLAVPEPHKDRDHWHIHAAVHGWINVNMLRRMWHASLGSILGRKGADTRGKNSPGNVDVQYRGRASGVHKTRRIAGYIAKYITKDLVQRFNKKRYWHTKGLSVPEAQRAWLESDDLDEAIREAMRGYGLLVDGAASVKVWRPGSLAFWWVETGNLDPPPF